ncbi:DUF596 domain-containing protein [Xylella fastidiosa]|uniref:DUF596 domain-containing protein n=1 Tax=Xylella fastidiosa TaxID=2371 RepID=UPI00041A3A3F|nr:DUF596 domain-containing protein [Xylella fastidiosa]ALQ98143.1 DUF596 domain-containing protein [Xylella fastidiosa]ALR05453.1 DUF596 domain-containing protein [Xylella fastidiosa]KXB18840.1 hypothetical protein ADT30_09980 [Xylella fastidiosa]OJZ69237.1 hypothetical protein B375_0211495 [Xylella fastidiosa 6c]WGZ32082.1 DUF596 domain-containing protein [Xylella fastidiosa subsp. pauca]
MLTQQQIDDIYEYIGIGFHSLWVYVGNAHEILAGEADPGSFEERKNDFFFLVGKLLDEGLLKLGNRQGGFFTGTTEELVEMFRGHFPISDEEVNFAGVGGLWLVTEDCPFVAVWVFKGEGENGEDYYDWCF